MVGVETAIRIEAGVVRVAALPAGFGTGQRSIRHPSERWGPATEVAPATAGLDSSLRWNDGR
jgi:hypothetical protein